MIKAKEIVLERKEEHFIILCTCLNALSKLLLMTMFRNVHNHRFLPAKKEITNGRTKNYGETQPDVVSHEDKHQEV